MTIPEPYATKARALLKPWHPILMFDLWMEDGDLLFGVEIRNLMCRNEWILDHFKFRRMTGFFPLEAFDGTGESFDRFSAAVFRAIHRFVHDLLPDRHLTGLKLVPDGQMDILAVAQWLKQVTSPLTPWIDWHINYENEILSLVGIQPKCRLGGEDLSGWFFHDTGRQVRPWHHVQPAEFIGLNMAHVAAECAEIAQAEGVTVAEYKLRKLLYDRLTNGLYFMRFAIPESKAKTGEFVRPSGVNV